MFNLSSLSLAFLVTTLRGLGLKDVATLLQRIIEFFPEVGRLTVHQLVTMDTDALRGLFSDRMSESDIAAQSALLNGELGGDDDEIPRI